MMKRPQVDACILALFLSGGLPVSVGTTAPGTYEKLTEADNPRPDELPRLSVWKWMQRTETTLWPLLSVCFPELPDAIVDLGVYEIEELNFLGAEALPGGGLKLRHRYLEPPSVILVTTVTPEPGAVELVARIEPDPKHGGPVSEDVRVPKDRDWLEVCTQFERAPAFSSAPEAFPEFKKRCFLFTPEGRTFLHHTVRVVSNRGADDPTNQPPFVQQYAGTWQSPDDVNQHTSPTRYTTTVNGIVTRDRKHLAAMVNDSALLMRQMYHDCLHNSPVWLPKDRPRRERTWRLKFYLMENDPAALLKRVGRDFPDALRQAEAPPVASDQHRLLDTFDDGVWDADDQWDVSNFVQGGKAPDTIELDETIHPGTLAIRYIDDGGDSQATVLARPDAVLEVGEWVKIDVALSASEPRIANRVGLALLATTGRGPAMGLRARENLLVWGLRSDGLARGHAYGEGGVESGDFLAPLDRLTPGSFYTFLIRRTAAARYELYFAPISEPLEAIGRYTAPGPPEAAPRIPGIFLDAGLSSSIVFADDFTIGANWPLRTREVRVPAPVLPVPEPQSTERQIELVLPDDIQTLPRLERTISVVHRPRGDGDFTYHHGAELASFGGKLFLAWHATPRSEATPPFQAWLSSSSDGETWTSPLEVGAATHEAYLEHTLRVLGRKREALEYNFFVVPRNFHATESRLYLWTLAAVNGAGQARLFYTDNGDTWQQYSLTELDRLQREDDLLIRNSASNRGFAQLSDGRLLAAHLGPRSPGGQLCAPITSDLTGLSGWSGGRIDTRDCSDVGEPNCWEGGDGVLHYTARGPGVRVWHSYSVDRGKTWSKLRKQPRFSDNPGNKKFGRLPDGSIFYIGNPVPGSRMELVVATSLDGWRFDRCYLLQWETVEPVWPDRYKSLDRPGYEYPTGTVHDGHLFVAYSRTRDWMEVTKVHLNQLARTNEGENKERK